MFTKGTILYADPYKYLRHKSRPVIALSVSLTSYSPDDFDELPMDIPLAPELTDGKIFWQGRRFVNIPESLSYAGIKTSIIKSRYTPDDQMALILNRDRSEADTALYEQMQQWRAFAADIAAAVTT
ncbi:hypothetical protein [uncultured Duncaniella sp.]|uniref:hypothetical protein n=1 Tax=uncultured Duncaniella sp. TaxID=2768039 RepID=UPI00262BA392|nr:hypothetical protein [uncultured Duncaniella sp.]